MAGEAPGTRDEDAAHLSRRRFLSRIGALSLGAVVPAALGSPAAALLDDARSAASDDESGEMRALLRALARDTMGGLVALVVPGVDAYSLEQGVLGTDRRGGIHARAHEFLLEAVDNFYPVPERYAQAMAQAFATGVSDTPVPEDLRRVGPQEARTIDDALQEALHTEDAAPLSLVVALMMNYCATATDPSSASGPFLSPFANLSFDDKLEAWRFLEEDNAELAALVDEQLTEPSRGSMSGLLKFVAGALPEFAAFGSYGEWAVFDREQGIALERPIGWEISNYMPGRTTPADGWNEFKGYYRGRRSAD